ncbi:hypothetical protein B7463_g8838, partial [Scytalidium lignicola]
MIVDTLESICQVQQQQQQQPHAIPLDPFRSFENHQGESTPFWNGDEQIGNTDEAPLMPIENESAHKHVPVNELDNAAISTTMNSPTAKPSIDTQPRSQESPVNAMGTTSVGYHRVQLDSEAFYGQSSAASFFNQVHEVFYCRTSKSPYQLFAPPATRSQNHNDTQSFSQSSEMDSFDDCSLPPRTTADKLLDLYRRRVYGLYPFIHWQTLLNGYKRLWDPEPPVFQIPDGIGLGASDCALPIFYAALNIMLALGLQFSDESFEKREAMSKVFFRRARRLFQIDVLDDGNLGLVQALLILAQYLQSTNLPNRCWNIVGLACRVAQALGLHLQEGDESRSQLALEIRRRTWHGCVLLDTVLSMTLGRPATTSYKSAVPLPRSIDDEYLVLGNSSCVQPEKTFARTTFFVQTLSLNKILSEVLSKVYNPWNEVVRSEDGLDERSSNNMIGVIVELDAKLVEFEQDLPGTFRWDRVDPEHLRPESLVQLQRNVLAERFFLIRGLLYRPMFVNLCRREVLQPISNRVRTNGLKASVNLFSVFGRHCSTTCIESAQQLIHLVYMTADALGTGGGAWWYNLYYTFTSALVLILSDLFPSSRTAITNDNLARSWQQCQDIMTLMCNHSSTARELFRVLQKMQIMIKPDDLSTDSRRQFSYAVFSDSLILPDSNLQDTRNIKFSGSRLDDDHGALNPNIGPVSDLPDLGSNFDPALHMEESGLMDFLWKDCWTFASGVPMTWEGE